MRSNSSTKLLRVWQLGLFFGFLLFWYVATSPTLLPPAESCSPHIAPPAIGLRLDGEATHPPRDH